MTLYDAADLIAAELRRKSYTASNNQTIEPWDRVFFGAGPPEAKATRPCVCGGTLRYADASGYLCGQWQCDQCTRLFGATVAETVGALRALLGKGD